MSAPTSGPLLGILFFEDRVLGGTSTQNQVVGGASTTLNGALYFKRSNLTFSGNGSSTGYLLPSTLTLQAASTVRVQ